MEGLPDITEILRDPCSSCAIRSASSINSIPKPYMKKKLSVLPQLTVNTDITQMCKGRLACWPTDGTAPCMAKAHLVLELDGVSCVHRDNTAIPVSVTQDLQPDTILCTLLLLFILPPHLSMWLFGIRVCPYFDN